MGVPGLLPLVQPVTKRVQMSEYKGKRVGIDGFTWLHKAAYSCCKELFYDPATPRILPFCVRRLRKLMDCGLIPTVVFDGRALPAKAATDAARKSDRDAAIELINKAASPDTVKRETYQKAISIKWETVSTWIASLEEMHVPFVIAPYEADAQLAYMARQGEIDCVLTEDSDLLPYLCPLTLFKLDDNMYADAVKIDDVLNYMQMNSDEFITLCVLLGCDYASHIRMMGPKTAVDMVKTHHIGPAIIAEARKKKKFTVPENYEEEFTCAFTVYHHQMIYDRANHQMKPLTPITGIPPAYIGPLIPREELTLHVTGKVDTHHTGTAPQPEQAPVATNIWPAQESRLEAKKIETHVSPALFD